MIERHHFYTEIPFIGSTAVLIRFTQYFDGIQDITVTIEDGELEITNALPSDMIKIIENRCREYLDERGME